MSSSSRHSAHQSEHPHQSEPCSPCRRSVSVCVSVPRCAALQRLTTSWSSDRRSGKRQALFISAACATLRRLGAEVQLHWVAGHHGVPGNERADLAARTAASAERTSEATLVEQVSINVIRARLAELAVTQQRAAWDRLDGHSSLRAVQPAFNKGNGDRYLDLPVAVAQRLLQWRAGTALIRFHIGRVDACECGAANPDRDHFLLHCPRTAAARAAFLSACGEPRLTAASILNSKTAIVERDRLLRAATASIRDDGAPAPSVASPSVTPHQSTSAASSLRPTAEADSTSRPQDSDATNGLHLWHASAHKRRPSLQALLFSHPRVESTSIPIGGVQPHTALVPPRAQPRPAPSLIPVRRTTSRVSSLAPGHESSPAQAMQSSTSTRSRIPRPRRTFAAPSSPPSVTTEPTASNVRVQHSRVADAITPTLSSARTASDTQPGPPGFQAAQKGENGKRVHAADGADQVHCSLLRGVARYKQSVLIASDGITVVRRMSCVEMTTVGTDPTCSSPVVENDRK
ncbi:uncharacterized protein SRS1_16246 [Sporisorium reilianum f. sp. reilianum]|uniref:Uncharacterized protein n=1 Tax=Sporisorium reilianum f. sp. reilianum TaxID=72559 RepID=A0A2N8ULG7_9BASI|nr:uncharacterized protein SRS1_16246 [Sporisorium reilianum f. sp. reilianum]